MSFQSVAATSLTSSPFGQTASKSSSGFAGAGSPLFASKATGDLDESVTEGEHDGPHFEPIIPLPDKIDVKTGEEDEEVMFSHRAKLYRYVADDKQWKERGVGDIKLLRNRQSGKMRVLMRRDQVLKICANHQITIDMKLQPNAGSDRSWVWSTLADFSEQECKAEQLAVRFKSEDIAKQFKEKFEECQELLKNKTPVKALEKEEAQEEVKDDLVTKFKAAEGSWECDICMLRNDSEKVECAACGGLKSGAEPRQHQKKDMKKSFSFGSSTLSSSSVFSFVSSALPTDPEFSFNQTPSSGAGFSFGSTDTSQGDGKAISSSFGSFSQTSISSSEVTICVGSFTQKGNLSEHTVENQNVTFQLDDHKQECKAEQLAVRFKSEHIAKQFKEKFEECQELLKNQTPVKTLEKEEAQEEVKDDLLTKFKAAEGSWECDICMLRNDSDNVACAACGGLKPGAEPRQDQQKDTKTFLFGSTASSSGSVFSFGSASPSTGAGFSFGSAGTSQCDERFLPFGSFGEVQNSKTGIPIRFGFCQQEEHVTEQQTEDNKETDSPTVEEIPGKEVEDKNDEEAQIVQDVESATEQAQAEDSNKEETKLTVER